MSQVQMPDLALNPEKSLSPNPLYPDYAPHGAILPTLEEKTQKGGDGSLGGIWHRSRVPYTPLPL